MADRAYFITGGVVVSDDMHSKITYHPQCPYCNTVMQGQMRSGVINQGTKTTYADGHCTKCGRSFQVKVARGC